MEFDTANYLGLDSDQWYIDTANNLLGKLSRVEVRFERQDFIYSRLKQATNNKYNLVTLFGLLHHIPSRAKRLELITNIYNIMPKGEVLVFTLWNFLGEQRLRKRIVDLDSQYGREVCQKFSIDKSDLEQGDYILDWVKYVTAFRYAHYFDDKELASWRDLGFDEVTNYLGDGRFSLRNKYYIWVKK
jgi:hypothetical protein